MSVFWIILVSFTMGGVFTIIFYFKLLHNTNELIKKLRQFYKLLIRWMRLYQEDMDICDYFIENNYKTVAVYGYKEIGAHLVKELELGNIEVKYIIDRDAKKYISQYPIYTLDDELDSVDVVVVTAIYYYNLLEPQIKRKLNCEVVSISTVLSAMEHKHFLMEKEKANKREVG